LEKISLTGFLNLSDLSISCTVVKKTKESVICSRTRNNMIKDEQFADEGLKSVTKKIKKDLEPF